MKKVLHGLYLTLIAPVLVAIVSVVSIAIYARVTSGPDKPTRTEIRFYYPRDAHFAKSEHDRGDCGNWSLSDPGVPEAHRCFGETARYENGHKVTYLYDPCFDTFSEVLTCVEGPWSRTGTQFQLNNWVTAGAKGLRKTNTPFSPRGSLRKHLPWALELDNDQRCLLTGGATYTIAGIRANYFCGKGSHFSADDKNGGWVIGAPKRSQRLWLASYIATGTTETVEVEVRTAWY
jgi:hypothetical protein